MTRRNRIRGKRGPRGGRSPRVRQWIVQMGKGILSLTVLASLTILGYTLFQYFRQSASIPLGEIKIIGSQHAGESELLQLAGIDFTTSLMNLDLKEVSQRLRRHPWVEKAQVKRDWSRKALIIEVQERTPRALLLLDELYLVDRNGEVFKKADPKDRLDFPVLTGLRKEEIQNRDDRARELIRQALQLLSLLEERRVFTLGEVSEIHLNSQRGLTVYTLKGGIPIRMGLGILRISSTGWKGSFRICNRGRTKSNTSI
jgi:cell division protein FtsQ